MGFWAGQLAFLVRKMMRPIGHSSGGALDAARMRTDQPLVHLEARSGTGPCDEAHGYDPVFAGADVRYRTQKRRVAAIFA